MKPDSHFLVARSFGVLFAIILLTPCMAQAQGQLQWRNLGTQASPFRAPVYGVDPTDPFTQRTGNTAFGIPAGTQIYAGALLAGSGYSISLFVGLPGTPPNLLEEVQTSIFRTGIASGHFLSQGVVVTLPDIPPGVGIIAQCRAWNNQGGTFPTWASLPLDPAYGGVPGNFEVGFSDVFRIGPLGGKAPDGTIFMDPQTTEFRSFNLVIVPEPSTIALIALGLGALCWRIRRGRNS